MKKLLIVVLVLASVFTFVACSGGGANTFIDLNQNQSLYVGSQDFVNTTTEQTEEMYLTYDAYYKYTLYRSYSQNGTDYIQIGDYYYYWSTQTTTNDLHLGTKTTKSTVKYSYLPYGEDGCNVAVKTTYNTIVSCDYSSGMIETTFAYVIDFNGYFESLAALKSESKELANLIDISGTKKYYVDGDFKDISNYTVDRYTNTYYYLENNK